MLHLTSLRESDFTQGGDNMEAFRWVVDNTPARMFNAIWEVHVHLSFVFFPFIAPPATQQKNNHAPQLTYKYEESFSERLRSQMCERSSSRSLFPSLFAFSLA